LCDRLAVVDHGRILAEDTPAKLIEQYAGKEVVEIRAEPELLQRLAEQVKKSGQLPALPSGREVCDQVGDILYLRLAEHNFKVLEYFPELQEMDFRHRPASLEDVFLNLTGRELRD